MHPLAIFMQILAGAAIVIAAISTIAVLMRSFKT
jgi:hypothetical protein